LPPYASGRVAEERYQLVGRFLLLFNAANFVAVHASLRAKRMAMMMMASKAKRTKTLKAA
jgi:hypothetical protein